MQLGAVNIIFKSPHVFFSAKDTTKVSKQTWLTHYSSNPHDSRSSA